jgi:arsenical pump membrane protein
MTGSGAESLAVLALALCLFAAIRRPWSLSESVIGIPAALVLVLLGVVSPHTAGRTIRDLVPTVCFLAAILVFGHLCANVGIFDYLAGQAGRFSRGDPVRLLTAVVVLAGTVTAFLTLDATVVLLTPVVIVTVRQLSLSSQPYTYACVQLANAGSLLLPVSNLTNLLAFTAAGISFGKFAELMALPWLAIVILQWVSLRVFFRTELRTSAANEVTVPPAPVFGLIVLSLTLATVVVCSALDVAPVWAAAGGALALLRLPLRQRKTTPRQVIASANLGFCLFVFASLHTGWAMRWSSFRPPVLTC